MGTIEEWKLKYVKNSRKLYFRAGCRERLFRKIAA